MGKYRGKRPKTKFKRRKLGKTISNYWKVKKSNGSACTSTSRQKYRTSTPKKATQRIRGKRVLYFGFKSLSCTPIKSPFRKKRKIMTPSPLKGHFRSPGSLDKTWIYPLQEDKHDQNTLSNENQSIIHTNKKISAKRTLQYTPNEAGQTQEENDISWSSMTPGIEFIEDDFDASVNKVSKLRGENDTFTPSLSTIRSKTNSTETTQNKRNQTKCLRLTEFECETENLKRGTNAAKMNEVMKTDFEFTREMHQNQPEEETGFVSASESDGTYEMLEEVLKDLEQSDLKTEFVQFLQLVSKKQFPLNNVAFLLFMDVVKFFSTDDIRTVRYSDTALKFFWIGKKLFGGRFLRFMTGPKNEGEQLLGNTRFAPENSKINFACPSDLMLQTYNPLGYEISTGDSPGLIQDMIDKIAEHNSSNVSYVLSFDGKKIKRGSDVDLLGLEEVPLKIRQQRFDDDTEIIENTLKKLKLIDEQLQHGSEIEPDVRSELSSLMLSTFKVISRRVRELRKLKVSKVLSLERYREKIKKDPAVAKTLEYAIDSCRTSSYRIDNCIEVLMNVQWEVCRCGAYLNNALDLFAKDRLVTEECPRNAEMLKEVEEIQSEYPDDDIPTFFIKQRSDEWFKARKQVKVTGSSVYVAVGCDTLKRQKDHFDAVFNHIDNNQLSEDQKRAMEHGTASEKHQIATLTQVIMPFLFPDLSYHEEGYYVEDGVITSPDGSIRAKSGSVVYAFEGKAPVGNKYSTQQHYSVPERYITQTLFEDKVLKAERGTLYLCWTEESTTVFSIPADKFITDTCQKIIHCVYHSEAPTRPSRLTDDSKMLKSKLREHIHNCEFIGEFPSVKVEPKTEGRRREVINTCIAKNDTETAKSDQENGKGSTEPDDRNEETETVKSVNSEKTNQYQNANNDTDTHNADIEKETQETYSPNGVCKENKTVVPHTKRKVKGTNASDNVYIRRNNNEYENTSQRIDAINLTFLFGDIIKAILKLKDSLTECYNLQRKLASQVLVFLLSDLDRTWKAELPQAVPIMYCFRGYSLSMDIVRQLTEQCIKACTEKGIDIIATSSDGEFISLMVKDRNGEPLTLNQLSKVVWSQVCRYKKRDIVEKLQHINTNYKNETDQQGKIYATGVDDSFKVITTANGWRNMRRMRKNKNRQTENIKRKDKSNQVGEQMESAKVQDSQTETQENESITLNNTDIRVTETLGGESVALENAYINLIETRGGAPAESEEGEQNETEMQGSEPMESDVELQVLSFNHNNELIEAFTELPLHGIVLSDVEDLYEDIDDDQESDLDKTLPYNYGELLSEVNEMSRKQNANQVISNEEGNDILEILKQRNARKWKKTTITRIKNIINKSLKSLTKDELSDIAEYYNLDVTASNGSKVLKNDFIRSIAKYIGYSPILPPRIVKMKQPKSLKELTSKCLLKSTYPKEALNSVYSSYIWPTRVQEWRRKGNVASKVVIKGADCRLSFEPYYIPEYNTEEEDFRVFSYDKTHLGTNLRKCLCLDKIKGISINAWKHVSETKPNVLHSSLVEVSEEGKILDQMKEKLARTMVTEEVENQMLALGYKKEADFCNVIREGLYRADDTPGIPALERCKKRLLLMEWLDEGVNFGLFPPYGGYIKGMSHILYEGLRGGMEAKLYLYALSRSGSYNVRAPNTLCSESFFGTMQEADPWGQGILSADGVRKHMSDFTTITTLKLDTKRNIFIKTKKDAIYPSPEIPTLPPDEKEEELSGNLNSCCCRESRFISCIEPKNHFFDTSERARLYKGEKLYHPSTSDDVKGELPIRSQYDYKIKEHRMLQSRRLNINFDQ